MPLFRPGMLVHGLGPEGVTGPRWKDWSKRLSFFNHCSPSNGLVAPICGESNKMVTISRTVKTIFQTWEKPIFVKTATTTTKYYEGKCVYILCFELIKVLWKEISFLRWFQKGREELLIYIVCLFMFFLWVNIDYNGRNGLLWFPLFDWAMVWRLNRVGMDQIQ